MTDVPRVLVVEDDAGIRSMLDRGLRLAGYEPAFAGSVDQARQAWVAQPPAVVVLDVMLPDGDGIELLAERRAAGDQTPAIVVTAREDAALPSRGLAAGSAVHLRKPFAYAELVAALDRLAR